MEGASFEAGRLIEALEFACAELAEIFSSFGNDVGVELHFDAADLGSADGDIKEDNWVLRVLDHY